MRSKFYFFFLIAIVILIAVSLSTRRADAILAPDYDFSSAVVMADLIVKGKVIETRSEWVDGPHGKNIFTYVRIRVDAAIKGDPYGKDIEFEVMGGTVGDITQTVSDSATFNPTEEAIVLLEQSDTGIFHMLPGYGKISIKEEKISWANSVLSVDQFVRALNAFTEDPDSDFNQHLGLNQDERMTPLREDIEEMDVGLSVPSLEAQEIAEQSHEGAIRREHLSIDQSGTPDLRPYKLSSWDNTIVISNVKGTGTTASKIYDDETIYVDFSCGNYGSGDAGHFRYGLYIDGTRVGYVDKSSLQAGMYSAALDAAEGPLSAGAHTFKVVCDYNNEVSESNENNNEYSRTFTITARSQSGSPDLRPYKRSSWDNTIVISNVKGTGTTASKIYDDETIYVDFACANYGDGDAGHHRYGLYIDGTLVRSVDVSSRPAGKFGYVLDAAEGPLSAGAHTFKVVCDYNNEVSESNENNNEYSRTYTIFDVIPSSTISSVSPDRGSAGTGTEVTIDGSGFGTTRGNGKVEFWYGRGRTGDPDRIEAPIVSWSDTRIICEVPTATLNNYSASAVSGPLRVITDDAGRSNEVTFIVTFSYGGAKWENLSGHTEVLYRIKENTSDCTGEGAAVRAGAERWNSAGACFSFKYAGAHGNTGVGSNNHNDIMWTNSLPSYVLAVASRIVVGGVNKEADIAFNDKYHQWSCDDDIGPDEHDIQSVIVHELGHWLTLLDLYGDIGDGINDTAKVMYGKGKSGEVTRSLHHDDVSGIQWIYGHCDGDGPPRAMPWIPLLLLDD